MLLNPNSLRECHRAGTSWSPYYCAPGHSYAFSTFWEGYWCGGYIIKQTNNCWSRVAGSKRRALAFYFSIQIWYVFLISRRREESDPGLCMSSVLAKRIRLHSGDFRRILRSNTFYNQKSTLRNGILFASTKLMYRPRSDSIQHFDIKNYYGLGPIHSFPQRRIRCNTM